MSYACHFMITDFLEIHGESLVYSRVSRIFST